MSERRMLIVNFLLFCMNLNFKIYTFGSTMANSFFEMELPGETKAMPKELYCSERWANFKMWRWHVSTNHLQSNEKNTGVWWKRWKKMFKKWWLFTHSDAKIVVGKETFIQKKDKRENCSNHIKFGGKKCHSFWDNICSFNGAGWTIRNEIATGRNFFSIVPTNLTKWNQVTFLLKWNNMFLMNFCKIVFRMKMWTNSSRDENITHGNNSEILKWSHVIVE